MSALSRQEEEISSIESIYNSDEFSSTRPTENGVAITGKVCTFLELPTDVTLIDKKRAADGAETLPKVSHLPPLVLNFVLPEDYPLNPQSPPKFTLNCHWISRYQLSKLCRHLDFLWEASVADLSLGFDGEPQGTEILFTWANFLKYELFSFLEMPCSKLDIRAIQEVYDYKFPQAGCSKATEFGPPVESDGFTNEREDIQLDARGILEISSKPTVVAFLTEYNSVQVKAEFESKVQLCDICCEEKLGSLCVLFLPCRHVFCAECTSTYVNTFIGGGRASSITCPGTNCPTEADFNVIKELADPELFEKYDKMLIECALQAMGDIVYCPRKDCQFPVMREDDKLGRCCKCSYAFCVDCRKGFHGVNPCRFQSNEEERLIREYGNGNAAQRLELEKRYGKRRLQLLMETAQTKVWFADNSKDCPQCNTSIQKTFGCNKMTCWRCGVQFCWMCGEKVDPDFPYLHFQIETSKCYQLLFRGVNVDEGDLNDALFNEFALENALAAMDFNI